MPPKNPSNDNVQPSKHMSQFTLNLLLTLKHMVEFVLMKFVRVMTRTRSNSLPHTVNIPTATYAPWKNDECFQIVFSKIRKHTLVDVYRLYEIWQLLDQLKSTPGDILEVGVWRGGSGCIMAYRAKQRKLNSTVYLCDTFQGIVKASSSDNKYLGGEFSDTSPIIVRELADQLELGNLEILEGTFPDTTGQQLEHKFFRLCHVDVDTYLSAKDIVEWVWPRMSIGGVIIFDDYAFVGCEGITKLVNELSDHAENFFIHNLNGHALLIKRSTLSSTNQPVEP